MQVIVKFGFSCYKSTCNLDLDETTPLFPLLGLSSVAIVCSRLPSTSLPCNRMGPVTIVFSVLLVMTLAHGEFLMKSHLWDKHPDCIRVIDFTVDSVLWVGYAIVLLLLGATDLASLYSQTCVEQQCYMGMTRFGAPQGTHRAGYVVSGHVNWKSNVYSP